jgi:dihydrodipicolinate synthase/N-acetylneuraminate lyase
MQRGSISADDLSGVFAVPPLARKNDARRAFDFDENDRLIRHITSGGITRLLYGGNAFLYHITLAEYEQLLDWLASFPDHLWPIPSLGPAFGRALDQAALLRRHSFTAAMMLPCNDPRDAAGLERGLREVADAAAIPLILYLKEEESFGSDKKAGLDAIARLMDDGVCVAIKYAVVRPDPADDIYLDELLKRVDRRLVISGIGERPAITHMRDWGLPGFTTGSGCLAPRLSRLLFEACARRDYTAAEELRQTFIPHEDLRDAWGPARVLHQATELAAIAATGPLTPYVSALSVDQLQRLAPVAQALVRSNGPG